METETNTRKVISLQEVEDTFLEMAAQSFQGKKMVNTHLSKTGRDFQVEDACHYERTSGLQSHLQSLLSIIQSSEPNRVRICCWFFFRS